MIEHKRDLSVAIADGDQSNVRTCITKAATRLNVQFSGDVDANQLLHVYGICDRRQQLAVATYMHWALINEGIENPSLQLRSADCSASEFLHDALNCSKELLSSTHKVTTVLDSAIELQVQDEDTQVIDCRPSEVFAGMAESQELIGHLPGAQNLPFQALFNDEDEEAELRDTMVSPDDLQQLVDKIGVKFDSPAVTFSDDAAEAALVATQLSVLGHDSVSFCVSPLSLSLLTSLPTSLASNFSLASDLTFVNDDGNIDISPQHVECKSTLYDSEKLIQAYDQFLAGRSKEDKDEESDDDEENQVVYEVEGQRFFDMPSPVSKSVFLDSSRAIFRMVSFVLAPFGFPSTLQGKLSLSNVKTQCGSLYQDVIEVCSDLVYNRKGLSEGAMAMSVHKWVEEKKDRDCKESVRQINEMWDALYTPPRFVEVPDWSQEHTLEVAQRLKDACYTAVQERSPWAFEEVEEAKEEEKNGEWGCMYPSVVYSLNYIPRTATTAREKLSTLQLKSFIQAVAEAVWNVLGEEEVSQMQFQALCDAMSEEEQEKFVQTREDAVEHLYATTHFLTRAVATDEEYMDEIAAVHDAAEDGDRKLRMGRYNAALEAYANAFPQLPVFHHEMSKVLVGRARCFFALGDYDSCKAVAKAALQVDKFSSGAYSCLAKVEEKENTSKQAMQDYVTAFILDGSRSPDMAETIDRVSRVVGRDAAKDIFAGMEKQHTLPSQWLVDSYFDSFEHDAEHAVSLPSNISKLTETDASELSPHDLLLRAIHFQRKRQYEEAQKDIILVADMELENDEKAMAMNMLASYQYVAGDVDTALATIEESLTLKPQSVNALVKKGGFLSELGAIEEATACFDAAADVDANDADIYLHMGQMHLLTADYQQAVECLRRAIARSDALPVTHVSYGMALYKSGSTFQARDVFDTAAKLFPESPEVHLFYGEVLVDQANYAEAMRHFWTSLELSPKCPLPFLNAGRVYVATNDPLRAIAHFHQALVIDERCSSAHLDIAQVLFAQGRTNEAFGHFDRAATCCRFLPEVEEVCACRAMAQMQLHATEVLGVDLRHIMRDSK